MANAATGFVGALCLTNLLLTFLLIRRVNRHSQRLARRGAGPAPRLALPAGGTVPMFTVSTIFGGTYSLASPDHERSLVAFLAPGCPPCHRQIPELRDYASSIPGGARRVLVVVLSHSQNATPDFAYELADWASVTLEPPDGSIQKIFAVSSYPSFYTLTGDGRIEAGSPTVRHLVAAAGPA